MKQSRTLSVNQNKTKLNYVIKFLFDSMFITESDENKNVRQFGR